MKMGDQKYKNLIMKAAADKKIIRSCMLEILDRCNYNCEHCYVHNTYGAMLGYEHYKKIIDELCEIGCFSLLITGGEPLLHPNFREMYRYAVKKGLLVTVFTNGYLLNQELCDLFAEYKPESVEISIYGVGSQKYDAYVGVKGAFAQFEEAVDKMKNAGIPIKLKTVLTRKFAKEFEEIQTFCDKKGVELRYDGFIVPKVNGDGKLLEEQCCEPEEILKYDCVKNGFLFGMKKKMEIGNYANSDELYPCDAGKNSLFIDASMNLSVCAFARHISVNLDDCGSIKEGQKLLLHKLEEKRKLRSGDPCYRCEKKDLCRYCPGQFLLQNGSEFIPIEWNCRYAEAVCDAFKELDTGKEEEEM